MITSHHRGWQIEYDGNQWIFSDTKKPVETWEERPCGHCGKQNTVEGHDGCLGTLPGIMNACCGHGREDGAYLHFLDGSTVDGEEAIEMILSMKTCPLLQLSEGMKMEQREGWEYIASLANQHKETWLDKSNAYWFFALLEEFVELGLSLLGLHKDKPEWELIQIAAICINWIRKYNRNDKHP